MYSLSKYSLSKYFLLASLCLLIASNSLAQSTTVSGQVTDLGGQSWNNGTFTFQFIPNNNFPSSTYSWTGGVLNQIITGVLNATGGYSQSVPSNTSITPSLSQWRLQVCSGTTPVNCFSVTQTITGGSQTVNVTPTAIVVPPGAGNTAYVTGEVSPAVVGSQIYIIGSGLQVCSTVAGGVCTVWTGASSSSSPSPGVFNSNFDPPLFQCYSAATGCQAAFTATGPSASIDLRGNPLDTQQLSRRLGGNGVITSITDTMTYANGNLNTANPNWVFQVGTYTISSNVAYGQSALALSYRSDGANTSNEWAQTTMTITGNTQATGPCVRMQSGASTAYCLVSSGNLLRLFLESAGVGTALGTYDSQAPVTGDVLKIAAVGSVIMAYKCPGGSNCVLLGSVADTTITGSGFTGIFSNNGPLTQNGINNFQSGTFISCNLQIDSSPDGSTWTSGGLMSSQACVTANPNSSTGVSASSNFQTAGVANFVRVNVTVLTVGQTLTVIYSGRISTTPAAIGAPVSNGQWVSAGEVVWTQFTTQQNLGIVNYFAGYRLQTVGTNGTNAPGPTITNSNTVACNTAPASGLGFGFVIQQSGWLNGVTAYLNTTGQPQGTVYINLYVLPSMPPGGSTSSCGGGIGPSTIGGGMLLASCPYGSFYPCSFVGTSSIPISPWSIPGFTTTLVPSTPATGAELAFTFSSTARTCIQSISFTAAAGSTNITPLLLLTINGSKLAYSGSTAQTSGTTQNYSFSPGAAVELVTGTSPIYHIVPFNNGQMVCTNSGLSTLTLATLTNGLNGTTAYTVPSILVQVQQDNN